VRAIVPLLEQEEPHLSSCLSAPQSQHPFFAILIAISCQLAVLRSVSEGLIDTRAIPDNKIECFTFDGWKEGTKCHVIVQDAVIARELFPA